MSMSEEPWTIGRLLTWTIEYLNQHGAENPRLDAEVLLAHARGRRRIDLYATYGEEADEKTRTEFRELVRRRAAGTPVAYLVGHREFYSLDFEVTPDVLIPRPETEHLAIALLDHVKGQEAERAGQGSEDHPDPSLGPHTRTPLTIADIGTGSGILAIIAAKYVPNSLVTAIDSSPAALAVARRNAERHGMAERIEFVVSDLFANVPPEPQFDYIVSNPPYITTAEMAQLPPDVRDHEPHAALHGGESGMDVIKPLVEQASSRLKSGGVLLIEVSPMIASAVENLIRSLSMLEIAPTLRDLAGHQRVVQAKLAGTRRVP